MTKLPIIAAAAAVFAAPAIAALGVSASGQGTLEAGRTFSFSARVNADGTATGTAMLTNRAFTGANGHAPYQLQIAISCGKMVDQHTMIFGGTTRRTNDPSLVDAVFFSVQDNGEPGAGRDKISRATFWDDDPNTQGDPATCQFSTIEQDVPLETIQSGNVQVRMTY